MQEKMPEGFRPATSGESTFNLDYLYEFSTIFNSDHTFTSIYGMIFS